MDMTMNTQMDAYALYCEKYGEKINQVSEMVSKDETAYLIESCQKEEWHYYHFSVGWRARHGLR